MKRYRYLRGAFALRTPRISAATPLLLSFQEYHQPTTPEPITPPYKSVDSKDRNMSQYTATNTTNFSNNTNAFNNNVWNNYTIADDRSQLLAWLSPIEPKLRHRDIQENRVDYVGEWLMRTEEFRTWRDCRGETKDDNAVLFCYGAPGVGKTFIR